VTHGARTCPISDMVPRRRESRRVVWCNCRVVPYAVMRLMAQPACTACPPVTSEQAVRLSRARPLSVTGRNLNRRTQSSSSLCSHSHSHLSLSLMKTCQRQSIRHHRPAPSSHRSSPPPVVVLTEGCSPLLTE
jgi:hypothetical protein